MQGFVTLTLVKKDRKTIHLAPEQIHGIDQSVPIGPLNVAPADAAGREQTVVAYILGPRVLKVVVAETPEQVGDAVCCAMKERYGPARKPARKDAADKE